MVIQIGEGPVNWNGCVSVSECDVYDFSIILLPFFFKYK